MALYKARLWLITATPPLLCVVTRYKSWRINLSYTESRFFFFLFLSSEVNFPSWTTLTELWHVLLSSCHHYTKPLSGLFYWICLENILFIWTHELIIKASLLGTLCWNVYSLIQGWTVLTYKVDVKGHKLGSSLEADWWLWTDLGTVCCCRHHAVFQKIHHQRKARSVSLACKTARSKLPLLKLINRGVNSTVMNYIEMFLLFW